jgi:flagellar motor switch protein FliG
METSNSKGIFINGKQQMIELLQYLQGEERVRLLENIYRRNPAMAKELMVNSLNFESLYNFEDEQIELVARYIKPAIWGLALKFTNTDFQRQVLSVMPREKAEAAYHILTKDIPNEARDSQRAKNKILQTVISLSKKGYLVINP